MKRLTAALLCGFAFFSLAPSASAAIRITKIYYNSPGPDNGSNASLNGEWITIRNTGAKARQLRGWKIRDTDRYVFRFSGFRLPASTTVKVHTGTAPDTFPHHLYWDLDEYVWDNDADTASLRNAGGTLVDRCSYNDATVSYKVC
jgi:hypothetical protein